MAKTIKLTDKANKKNGTDIDENILAKGGNDIVDARGGDDTIDGGSGDDKLTGGSGDDFLIGGIGTDTAVFSGDFEDEDGNLQYSYQLADNGRDILISDNFGNDGNDTLRDIEFVKFSDQTLPIEEFMKLVDEFNDNTDNVAISIDSVVAGKEGSSGQTEYTFNIRLSKSSDQPVLVHVATEEGTATAGEDFQSIDEDIEFLPGETLKSITVIVNADKIKEGDEEFRILLSDAEGADINETKAVGVGRILNDDKNSALLGISIADVQIKEGDAGNKIAEVTVSLSGSSSKTISVSYNTLNGSADDSDFEKDNGTLTFKPGDTKKVINIPIFGDTESEDDETFSVILSNAKNGQILKSQSIVTITNDDQVKPDVTANQNPVAKNDTFTALPQDKQVIKTTADLLVNDIDPDGNPLILTSVNGASGGIVSLNAQNQVVFTPDNGTKTGSFLYTISDGKGGTSQATVNLDFQPSVNHSPSAKNDSFNNLAGNQVVIKQTSELLSNDTDPDQGDALSIFSVNNAVNGTVNFNNNQVTFTPTTNATQGSFDYTINDGKGGSSSATVSLVFVLPNQQPIAVDDTFNNKPINQAVALTAQDLLSNDSDPDKNDTLSISAVTAKTGGTAALNNGAITFTPSQNATSGSFEYTLSDGHGGSDTGQVSINFVNNNKTPTPQNDSFTGKALNQAVTLTNQELLANDTDPDKDPLTLTAVSNQTNGTVTLSNGAITFTPNKDVTTGSFQYTVNDGKGATANATVTIGFVTTVSSMTTLPADMRNYADPIWSLTADPDTFDGAASNDKILGLDGNDNLNSKQGNDYVDGGNGKDIIYGEDGDDYLIGGNDNDTIDGGAGNDSIDGGIGDDSLSGGLGDNIIMGGIGNDNLSGSGNLSGGDGDDQINANNAATVDAGSGNDKIYVITSKGATIYAGPGSDWVINYGSNLIYLGDGNDTIEHWQYKGQYGNSTVYGGNGNDYIGAKVAYGEDGDDYLIGGILAYSEGAYLDGGINNDTLVGTDYSDKLIGDQGVDNIITSSGADSIIYEKTTDSGVGNGNRDIITDFDTASGDIIFLYQVTPNNLSFIGTTDFDGSPNAVRIDVQIANKITVVQLDIDGNKAPDMEIELTGLKILSADDFILTQPV